MISAILTFFLMALLFLLAIAGSMAVRIYKTYHNVKRQFRDFAGDRAGGQRTRRETRERYEDEVIIDQRTPEEAQRKIFEKTEGEYVDFEEEK